MCHRLNCNCHIQKPLDEFYASCYECGALIDTTPAPVMDITTRPEKRSIRSEQRNKVRTAILAQWAEIKSLRLAFVGIFTIKKTLDLPGHPTTILKHITELLAGEGGTITVPAGKKKQCYNYGVVKRQHKQDSIAFGSAINHA